MRQPYGARIASTVVYAHPSWYAQQGYLVVVLDVRGRGESSGQFQGFSSEASDGDDCLRWLQQHPLCNGRIGFYGFSYQGLTQLLGGDAGLHPDAMAPAMCGLDERLHWASEGGAHWWVLGLTWGLQLAAESCRRDQNQAGWYAIRRCLESTEQAREGLQLLQQHDPGNPVLAWLQNDPDQGQNWVSHQPSPERLRRPMQLLHGWNDPYLRGGLNLWQQSIECGGSPELIIGPWSHLAWDRRIRQQDLGPAACAQADQWQLAFFNEHLRDQPRRTQPHCKAYDLRSQLWRERDPRQACLLRWGLSSSGLAASRSDEGQLCSAAQGGQGDLVWVHDPWRVVPGRGGHLGIDPGICERGDLDGRADVACFTSSALLEAVELWGQFQLLLTLRADQPGFDLCAALSVLPAGSDQVLQLSTGVLRQRGPHCLEARQRELWLQPLLASLEPGDRLRLSLAASAWPQISLNPGDGSLGLGGSSPNHAVITLQADLKGSWLQLKPMVRSGPVG